MGGHSEKRAPLLRSLMEDDPRPRERHYGLWLVGAIALAAWFAMLWFMFGDVM